MIWRVAGHGASRTVNERSTTSQALPGAFGLEDAPMLTTRLLNKSAMAVTEIRGQPSRGSDEGFERLPGGRVIVDYEHERRLRLRVVPRMSRSHIHHA